MIFFPLLKMRNKNSDFVVCFSGKVRKMANGTENLHFVYIHVAFDGKR